MLDDAVVGHGVSWLLAPVFSEPSELHRWEHQKAKHYATAAGTTTVVANSLVVGACQGATTAAASLVHGPGGTAMASTNDPTEVMQFRTGATVERR